MPRPSKTKAKEYFALATENEKRASETTNPELKKIYLDLAAEYRDLAEYFDDPEQWRAKLLGRSENGQ